MWAAIGNLLRLNSLLTFAGLALFSLQLPDLLDGMPSELVGPLIAFVVVSSVFAVLLWMAKPALVSGSPFFVRWLVGLWVLLGIIGSFGFYLIFIAIAYVFTSEPEQESIFSQRQQPAKPRFKPPRDWRPTGRIGPSGAMVYAGTDREGPIAMFVSWLPVQIVERRDGYTRVVAATGEAGWIDDRTVTEGV